MAEDIPLNQVLIAALVFAFYYKWLYYIAETGLRKGKQYKLLAGLALTVLLATIEWTWIYLVYDLFPMLGIYFDKHMPTTRHYVFDRMELRQNWISALLIICAPVGLRLAFRKNSEKEKAPAVQDTPEPSLSEVAGSSTATIRLTRVVDRAEVDLYCQDIAYVSIRNNILSVRLMSRKSETYYCSLQGFMDKDATGAFFRVHRGFAIRIEAIRTRKGNKLELQNWETVPIGKSYSRKLNDLIRRMKEK